MKHYTEQEIQEYLESRGDNDPVSGHFLHCDDCRKRLEEYQLLYKGLTFQPEMKLSSTFNATVIARLGDDTATEILRKYIRWFVPGALFLVAALVAVTLLYGPAVWQATVEVFAGLKQDAGTVKGEISNMVQHYKMLPVGILAFIVIFIFDKILQKTWAIGR